MKKFAVVIPSYNDAAGLWFTVAAAKADIDEDFAQEDYEVIGVVDGPEDGDTAEGTGNRIIHSMRVQEMCRIINADTRTPQKNRHIGLLATDAPYVFFLDSHVIPSRGFFKSMYEAISTSGAGIVHSPHCFWKRFPIGVAYGYDMNWKNYFWSVTAESKPKRDAPYKICLAGHGAIVVDRAQYLETGGYWHALEGWGGEEPQLNLLFWMLGKHVLIDPRVYHWHYMPCKRHMHEEHKSLRYVRNFLLSAYAYGGQKYFDSVFFFFTQQQNSAKTIDEIRSHVPVSPFEDLRESIPIVAAAERAKVCAGPFGGDLDKLREYFKAEDITN